MGERLRLERELLKDFYEIDFSGSWLLVKKYCLPEDIGWSYSQINVCVQVPGNYPSQAPYGIYVPSDLRINNNTPAANYQEVAQNNPPFPGSWGLISWSIDGAWIPNQDITKGANLLHFISSFANRFKMGRI